MGFISVPHLWASHIDVTAEYDLKMALDYAATANIDTLFLTTSGGVYTTTDTLALSVLEPLVIMAAPGLAQMPIITNSDPNQKVLDILREVNYRGYLALEYEGKEDPMTGVPRWIERMKKEIA